MSRIKILVLRRDGANCVQVMLIDWQMIQAQRGGHDLAMLLATSLSPADRRQHEKAIINAYSERLAALGIHVSSRG